MKKRNSYDIKADILNVAYSKRGALITNLVYLANLNFKIIKPYINELIELGYMRLNINRYEITDLGFTYLNAYQALTHV